MKTFILMCTAWIFASCTSNPNLSKAEAFKQIKEQDHYPRIIDYDIYCSDPEYARKLIAAGLETNGVVTIKKTQNLKDLGGPLITFSTTSQPYLLTTSPKDKSLNIQKVKLAEEDLAEVTTIKAGYAGKEATVDYITSYKNTTPFSALTTINFNKAGTRKAHFLLTADGWKIDR